MRGGGGIFGGNHVAARDVDFIIQQQGDGLPGDGIGNVLAAQLHGFDRGFQTRRQDGDGIACLDAAGFDLSHEAAIIVQFGIGGFLRAAYVLHGEAEGFGVFVVRQGRVFQNVEQGWTLIPVERLAAFYHHVAIQGGHGDEMHVFDTAFGGEFEVIAHDVFKNFLRVVDQIHFIHGDDQMRDADQMGDDGVPPGLREHAFSGIYQNNREVGGRRRRDHVAGVLLMPRRVGDDVFARAGREIAICHVDGDALLALGLQTIGEQGQIHRFHATLLRCSGDGGEGVGEDGFGVEQESPNQGALAVIDAAAGEKAQQPVVDGRGMRGRGGVRHFLEISFFFALFHRGFGSLVVQAGRAALGNGRGRGFREDFRYRVGVGFNRRGAGDVADGAKAHADLFDLFIGAGGRQFGNGHQRPLTAHHGAGMGEINARQGEVFALDVLPHIQFCPVGNGEGADVFAFVHAGVIQIPQFGTLVFRVPLTKFVAETHDALFGARLFFIPPRAADAAIETEFFNRFQERY